MEKLAIWRFDHLMIGELACVGLGESAKYGRLPSQLIKRFEIPNLQAFLIGLRWVDTHR